MQMAIWSLTEERIEKLMKQIGDKEIDMKKLIDTTPKQLWTTDLDAFIEEWRFQLDDDAKRAKKLASMGRRASTKLRIGGKQSTKKRKVDDSDGSEDDFIASKPTKAAASKPKAKTGSSLLSFLNKPSDEKPATKPLVNGIEQKPVARPPAVEAGLIAEDEPKIIEAADTKQRAQKKRSKIVDDDSDEDVFAAVAQEAKAKEAQAGSREGRAASRKPIKYADSDEDSDGNDLLGDVSKMVKGISAGTGADMTSKPLFSATARASSISHSIVPKSKTPALSDIDMEDETDYKALVPKDSPQKAAARSAREVVLSDNEDDSFGALNPKTALKPSTSKATTGLTKKAAPVAKASKTASAVPKLIPKKPTPPSPAAKAYAARLAKTTAAASVLSMPAPKAAAKPAAAARKKKAISDDEDEDVDDIANEILSDDDNDSDAVIGQGRVSASAAPAGRPSRRAAATAAVKSKYVVELDDEDSFAKEEEHSESEEGDFDEDDSE